MYKNYRFKNVYLRSIPTDKHLHQEIFNSLTYQGLNYFFAIDLLEIEFFGFSETKAIFITMAGILQ